MMQKRFLQAKVIRGYVNASFVWANNQAIRISRGVACPCSIWMLSWKA